jgi:hypothetical protein
VHVRKFISGVKGFGRRSRRENFPLNYLWSARLLVWRSANSFSSLARLISVTALSRASTNAGFWERASRLFKRGTCYHL